MTSLHNSEQKVKNLGEVATFACCLKHGTVPAWKIARELGYSLRTVRSHISHLKEIGVLRVKHNFQKVPTYSPGKDPPSFIPRDKSIRRHRWQQPNTYRLPERSISPLNPNSLIEIQEILREVIAHNGLRGAKDRDFLLLRILTLLGEIAARLRAEAMELLLAGFRYLRKKRGGLKSAVGVLEETKEFFQRRGRGGIRNTLGYFIWAIA